MPPFRAHGREHPRHQLSPRIIAQAGILLFCGVSMSAGFSSRSGRRPLDSVAGQPLVGTDATMYPFWSPDGRLIGFFADGKLKRID